MRFLFILLLFPALSWGQNNTVFQLWNEVGVSYKMDKKQSLGLDFSSRFDANGINTFFPQFSYRYKINKNILPSIDYRLISDRNTSGNFELKHRINANLQFSHDIDQLELDFRLRYQYSRTRFVENIEPEFGAALRYKTSIAYAIKKSDLKPKVSIEFFTGPMEGQMGYHLNRIRWNFGLSYDLKGPHSIQIAYLYDQRINSPGKLNRAILNLSYGYNLQKGKSKKQESERRNAKFL
jgi:hypothetical protein